LEINPGRTSAITLWRFIISGILRSPKENNVSSELPKPVDQFLELYPKVWQAFRELGKCCHEAGPLDEKTRRLVKLALSIGAGLEGATHSAVRHARQSGLSQEEINHVAALAVSTLGLPSAVRAFSWMNEEA
jgi:alkylhydroperoxidase/carboxymuconolactone decarboxylase family protein YurZ